MPISDRHCPPVRRARSDQRMTPARPRGLGPWVEAHLPETRVCRVSWSQGIFAVDLASVRRRPRGFYEGLARQTASCERCEVSHYLERLWHAIFGSPSRDCPRPADRRRKCRCPARTSATRIVQPDGSQWCPGSNVGRHGIETVGCPKASDSGREDVCARMCECTCLERFLEWESSRRDAASFTPRARRQRDS